jgi:hypothetical protein
MLQHLIKFFGFPGYMGEVILEPGTIYLWENFRI